MESWDGHRSEAGGKAIDDATIGVMWLCSAFSARGKSTTRSPASLFFGGMSDKLFNEGRYYITGVSHELRRTVVQSNDSPATNYNESRHL